VHEVVISLLYLELLYILDSGRISQVLGNLNCWAFIYLSVLWEKF